MAETGLYLSVVALVRDFPELDLHAGEEGTVVEVLDPGRVLVEFSDEAGETYALEAFAIDDVRATRTVPEKAS